MGRRIVWPKVKKIYWCPYCNTPLLEMRCPICGSVCRRIPLSDPGDARLAFERDIQSMYAGYLYEFGTSRGFSELMGRSVVLLNKAPYFDEMKEVYVDGVQIGRFYFDPFLRKWRFRVSKVGALRILSVDSDIIERVVVDRKRYLPMDKIRIDRSIAQYKQVLLVRSSSGEPVGLGYSIGGSRVIVYSWWGEEGGEEPRESEELGRKSSLEDVLRANEECMNIVESRAKKFITVSYEKMLKPLIASFSGGKDSLVSLHLAISLGLEPKVLFNNTGIELPETIDTVYRTVEKYGLELVEASANDIFWRAVYSLGIPGRDYRWCCKTCKLTPLHRVSSIVWKNGALNIVGQRALESIDRARSPRMWRLRWAPQLLNISPINEWSQLEVWLYIFRHKLSPNPLYFAGFERIGCFMCPASTLAELELVANTHKDLWSRWLNVLMYWADRLAKPREWIEYGLWRWNGPARYRTMIAKRLRITDRIDNWRETFTRMLPLDIVHIARTESYIEIAFSKPLNLAFLREQICAIHPKKHSINDERISAEIHWNSCSIYIDGSRIVLKYQSGNDVERLIDMLKILFRWLLCTGCRACEVNCVSGALKVVEERGDFYRPVISCRRCISCKLCMYNCPIADVYVEHVVAPLIFSDYEAWRRKTREHHNEILKKIREIVIAGRASDLAINRDREERDFERYAGVSQFFEF